MTIQQILQAISSAVYGRDVRNAIHDGIETCYNDVQTFGSGVTAATNAANTAAGAANTAKTDADAAATRANTAAANAERVYQEIQGSSTVISVCGKSGAVSLTASDVGAIGANDVVTDEHNGTMTSDDKAKLDGIPAGANKISVGQLQISVTLNAGVSVSASTNTFTGSVTVPSGAAVKVLQVIPQNGSITPTMFIENKSGTTFTVSVGGRNNTNSNVTTNLVVRYIVIE